MTMPPPFKIIYSVIAVGQDSLKAMSKVNYPATKLLDKCGWLKYITWISYKNTSCSHEIETLIALYTTYRDDHKVSTLSYHNFSCFNEGHLLETSACYNTEGDNRQNFKLDVFKLKLHSRTFNVQMFNCQFLTVS